MSANAISICPKCQIIRQEEINQNRREKDAAAAAKDFDKFEQLIKDHGKLCKDLEPTLLEYWEVGLSNTTPGVILLRYWCCCEKCKWEYSITRDEAIKFEGKDNGS